MKGDEMKSETYFEVTTLGDLANATRPRFYMPAEAPHGCQWFRTCDECRWPDCEVEKALAYDSVEAREKRGRGMASMARAGATITQLSAFFGLALSEVEEQIAPYVVVSDRTRQRDRCKSHLKGEAIRRRQEGEPEKAVAILLGVSTRQVSRWCQGIEGIEHRAGNRWRNRMPDLSRKRECINSASPCLSDRATASNNRTGVLV
jgi:hypothetical protein